MPGHVRVHGRRFEATREDGLDVVTLFKRLRGWASIAALGVFVATGRQPILYAISNLPTLFALTCNAFAASSHFAIFMHIQSFYFHIPR